MSTFIRKSILEREIIVIDVQPFYKIQSLLSNITNNIYQIAKFANTTSSIYKNNTNNIAIITNTYKNIFDILLYIQNVDIINTEKQIWQLQKYIP